MTPDPPETAGRLAAALGLQPHPEGGWYRRTWTAPLVVDTARGPRPSATAILYLLDGRSAWHRVHGATEVWCWHGGRLELITAGSGDAPAAPAVLARLGDPSAGNQPQATVDPGVWQSARRIGAGPALVSCVVSPGFDFADFELADV